MKMPLPVALLLVAVVLGPAGAQQPAVTRIDQLQANVPAVVDASGTGGRASPAFVYVPDLEKFLLTAGVPAGGARHFDTELFDPKSGRWANAYPPGSLYKAGSGPTDAPDYPARGDDKARQALALKDANGVSRMLLFSYGYGLDSRAHDQFAYDPARTRLVLGIWNRTAVYDPAARQWSYAESVPTARGNWLWGAMCYDPINKQIVAVGGSSDEPGATPGTQVYDPAKDQWRRVELARHPLAGHHAAATDLARGTWDLLSAVRARYWHSETAEQAKANLGASGSRLAGLLDALRSRLGAADLPAPSPQAARQSTGLLGSAAEKFGPLAGQLDQPTVQTLADLQQVHRLVERAANALAGEPPARGQSPLAFDGSTGKVVLFGGNGTDRVYGDTWVYDPKSAVWEQRWPKIAPRPRAGHALVYLPKARRVALVGGYAIDGGFGELPFEIWLYDTSSNAWSLLVSAPANRGPEGGPDNPWVAAANEDDLLVMPAGNRAARTTWAVRVDPAGADAAATALAGATPGSVGYASGPEEWEKVGAGDPAGVAKMLAELRPNQWTALNPPKYAPGATNRWGTTAYDPSRCQFLFWGGGHATSRLTDVAHYSVRTNRWTVGYPVGLDIQPHGGFYVKAERTFSPGDPPHIPIHAYQAYAYDPKADLMIYKDRAYRVAQRRWDPRPIGNAPPGFVMNISVKPSAHGAVCWSSAGLFLFDADTWAWKKLPVKGPALARPWCDGSGMIYDSKRDCLWLAPGNRLSRYDFADGTLTTIETTPPKRLGRFALWREQVYLPEADLILLMRVFDGANVAYDPAANKWYAVELPFVADGKRVGPPERMSWESAIAYDPNLDLVLINNSRIRQVWALRLDRKTATMTEIGETEPDKE